MVTVQRPGEEDVVYERVTADAARALVAAHANQAGAEQPLEHIMSADSPFFTKQQKVVLANSGLIDPETLEDYVARGGYRALAYALREMTPEAVCKEIIASGLRGRGGAGFPAGLKWDMVRKEHADKKYVVANGDGVGPAPHPGGHGHRRLRRGCGPGFPLCAGRISCSRQTARTRHPHG
jgi:bidirectional [NiFe] hydrogenase diaphorase subunit